MTTRTTLDWNAIRIGDALTPMTIDVTATVVVAGAIATRDFMPVHHDRDYAASQGSPNIFMNIITDNGYCSRFLTDKRVSCRCSACSPEAIRGIPS